MAKGAFFTFFWKALYSKLSFTVIAQLSLSLKLRNPVAFFQLCLLMISKSSFLRDFCNNTYMNEYVK